MSFCRAGSCSHEYGPHISTVKQRRVESLTDSTMLPRDGTVAPPTLWAPRHDFRLQTLDVGDWTLLSPNRVTPRHQPCQTTTICRSKQPFRTNVARIRRRARTARSRPPFRFEAF